MKKIWTILFVAIVAMITFNVSCRRDRTAGLPQVAELSAQQYYRLIKEAAEAGKKNDRVASLEAYKRALAVMPANPELMYEAARLNALLGRKTEAIRFLDKALTLGYGTMAERDPAFRSLRGLREFRIIQEKIVVAGRPIYASQPAFAIREKGVITEGIAYDPVRGTFYLGSTFKCKIIKVDTCGRLDDFTSEKQDGLRNVLGLKVDPGRRALWVSSAVGPPLPKGVNPKETGWSGVFKYDLDTGRLLKKYVLYEEGEKHLFSDLVVDSRGRVFITDSEVGAVYAVYPDTDKLELLLASDRFICPGGITLSPDGRILYVAHMPGVITIDTVTKACRPMSHPAQITLYGVDGLCWYRNGLIGIQNRLSRIVRLILDSSGLGVGIFEILEANNTAWDFPTTGVIAGDEFYYVASSGLSALQEGGTLPPERLKDIVLKKIVLNFPVSQRFLIDPWNDCAVPPAPLE